MLRNLKVPLATGVCVAVLAVVWITLTSSSYIACARNPVTNIVNWVKGAVSCELPLIWPCDRDVHGQPASWCR